MTTLLRWLRLRSLRSRLLVGVLAVTAAGLLTADVVGVFALSSYLYKRTDTQVSDALTQFTPKVRPDGRVPIGQSNDDLCAITVLDGSGKVLHQYGASAGLPIPPLSTLQSLQGQHSPTTVSGDQDFRIMVGALPQGRFLMVSQSLRLSTATVYQLVAIEAVVTALGLALAAVLALRVSRFVLRPLDRMTDTAELIADGELSHRVSVDGSPTEVARLGNSLNQMLGRLEHSFTSRQVAEDGLRQFVADASHELRTPLTSITGYAQLVRHGALADPDDLADAMRRVEDEAKRMASLVDELLLLARLDQGRPLESSPVDLAALAEAAVGDARAADCARTVRLVVDDGAHVVQGDRQRLHQVLANLLANVRAHTPAGTAAEVRIGRDGDREVIDVRDEGPGISAEQRDKVFERFFRGDASRSRTALGDGSGLGLSIVAAIAAAHGGGAEVRPSEHGAWLRVTLPATVSEQPTIPALTRQEVPSVL
ncbi:cell wall metabolism sensor histidine kinase WalK [Kutzneria buriramensis]|uniref:histidine kinase n=1 Tax=Kutzneria buriramensis TaxID=1045776 RepID=A0A3E0HQ43_9PSEU|nr:HAMP domain-containing sensor histidine kinase [Kutzneria buriramensis]REH48693.1 two-component system OmpR family sensor kinase [Kutzneria buriramensis]